jgi:hypothetical protein
MFKSLIAVFAILTMSSAFAFENLQGYSEVEFKLIEVNPGSIKDYGKKLEITMDYLVSFQKDNGKYYEEYVAGQAFFMEGIKVDVEEGAGAQSFEKVEVIALDKIIAKAEKNNEKKKFAQDKVILFVSAGEWTDRIAFASTKKLGHSSLRLSELAEKKSVVLDIKGKKGSSFKVRVSLK